MKIVITDKREVCIREIEKGTEVIVFSELLIGVFIFTCSVKAMKSVYRSFKWEAGELDFVSRFFFSCFTREEAIKLVRKLFPKVEIQEI